MLHRIGANPKRAGARPHLNACHHDRIEPKTEESPDGVHVCYRLPDQTRCCRVNGALKMIR